MRWLLSILFPYRPKPLLHNATALQISATTRSAGR